MTSRITAGGMSVTMPTTTRTATAQQESPPPLAGPGEQGWWIITRGEWDDTYPLGVFAGTEPQVAALVKDLETTREYLDPYDQVVGKRGEPYGYESTVLITSAADALGGQQ